MDIKETLATMLIFVFGIGFFILLQDALTTLDTSGWTFTGASFLISFLPVVPWIFLIGGLTVPIYILMRSNK